MNRSGIIVLSLVLAAPAWAQEVQEFVGAGGVVNWSKGTVSAEGNGLAAAGANPKTAGLLACRMHGGAAHGHGWEDVHQCVPGQLCRCRR
jgi:hypothetical protein